MPLGLMGDLAVFSIRKTLPVPCGGALVCHDPKLILPNRLAMPPVLSVLAKRLEKRQKAWLMPAAGTVGAGRRAAFLATRAVRAAVSAAGKLLSAAGSASQFDPDDESLHFPRDVLDWGAGRGLEQELARFDAGFVLSRRRANYTQLLESVVGLRSVKPLAPELPPGVCPLVFPIYADDADAIVRRFRQEAVSAICWWGTEHSSVTWSEYPDALWLKRHVVALPVHQDLGADHIARIAAVLGAIG
jgi:hypothetical protein